MQAIVDNKETLLAQLAAHGSGIRSYGVKGLGLFGSFKNSSSVNVNSDVDFLVEFEQNRKTYDNFMELSFYLEGLLGRKVELITLQSLSKYIGPHILKQVENVNF